MTSMYVPLCKYGCGKKSTHQTKKGEFMCATRPAGCPAILAKMQQTTFSRFGVPNASSLETIKERRKKISLEKYGVDNPSKSKEIKRKLGEIRREVWNFKCSSIVPLVGLDGITKFNSTKKKYDFEIDKITEFMYSTHQSEIDPHHKRSKEWHLDHRICKFYSYHAGIPAHIVGNICNLQLLPSSENELKGYTNSISFDDLCILITQRYGSLEMMPVHVPPSKTTSTHCEHFGTCSFCGNPQSHYRENNGKWCCEPHRNRCPAIKAKNKESQIAKKRKNVFN